MSAQPIHHLWINCLLSEKPESTTPDNWPNYLELGLGPEHIPELIQHGD